MSEIKESQLPIGQQVSSFRGLDTSQNSTLISVDDASLALGVNSKANATDVDKQFADRDTALTESLALKSDITYVDQQLLLKSDLKYVNQQLVTKASVGQLDKRFPMVNYMSPEEQIVPGMFAMSYYDVEDIPENHQVYFSVFKGTFPAASGVSQVMRGDRIRKVVSFDGSVLVSTRSIPPAMYDSGGLWEWYIYRNQLVAFTAVPSLQGKTYIFNVFYTKEL